LAPSHFLALVLPALFLTSEQVIQGLRGKTRFATIRRL
jgi:hypothetical protein